MGINKRIIGLFALVLIFLTSCSEDKKIMPRPIGQMRVEFPKHEYQHAGLENCNYNFDIPVSSEITTGVHNEFPCHKNIVFKDFNATLYLSYYELDTNDINSLIKESRDKVYEHVVKANSIDEIMLSDTTKHIHGILYDIKGNAATPFQFFITDSTNHFIRASLMFNSQANYDSLKPMIEYLKVDIENIIKTTEWK